MLSERLAKTIQTNLNHSCDEFEPHLLIGLKMIEKMRGRQTHPSNQEVENQWRTECLSTLARKWELAEELVRLESSYPSMKGILQEYLIALQNAIVDKVKGK
ncbi:hypothetical protein ACOB9N_10625 [Pasteurella multocida]|uniref:hypothetical protein n=1 Tax=Pasteurella multocida TaxID=747 RepID=UPI003BA2514C